MDVHQSFERPSVVLVGEVVPGLNARNWESSVKFFKETEDGKWKTSKKAVK